MFDKLKKQEPEKEAMTAEEIRAIREDERINSVYPEDTVSRKNVKVAVKYIAVTVAAAAILVGLFAFSSLTSYLCANIAQYVSFLDNSSGFLTEAITKVLQLALVLVVTVLFGFFIKIDFGRKDRPVSIWGKSVAICIAVALAADILFLMKSRILSEPQLIVSGTVISQIFYYITKICLVPFANIMLFLVIPSAIIKNILVLITDNKSQAEIPLIVATTVILTLGQLGMSWESISGAGLAIAAYALIQSAVYSTIYHRTEVVWFPILTYAGVTVFYYVMSWLMYLI